MKSLPFALRLPVVAAPMFLISGPDLVLAACKAGIVGAFPTPNARPIEQLEVWMKQITEGLAAARDAQPASTLGPWCANLVTHSSNTRLSEDLALSPSTSRLWWSPLWAAPSPPLRWCTITAVWWWPM
jgi:nitronate monooxygenase